MTASRVSTPRIRYSPKPIEHYGREIDGKFYGPRMFSFLKDDNEAWNLAFLSFDFSKRPVHTDAQFTVLVRHTVRTRLDAAGTQDAAVDLPGLLPARLTVRSLLQMPAPQFVKNILQSPLLSQLPLYQHFGSAWLRTIEKRSWLCSTHDDEPDDSIGSTAVANQVLKAISAGGRG